MSATVRLVEHFIDGTWSGEPASERRNPAADDEVVAEIVAGDAADVERAVAAAEAAFPAWARTPAPARGAYLRTAAGILRSRTEQVSRDLTREEGKTLAEATAEVTRAAALLEFYGSQGWAADGQTLPSAVPGTMVYTQRCPVGVVGIITPWNYPLAIPTWKSAPALIAGCCVVLKPADLTPVSTWHLARCLADAGLPPGVFNVVVGSGRTVGNAIVHHPSVAAISFTGSGTVGRSIYAAGAERRARVLLEMGGKTPYVVLDDADPTVAARLIAIGGYGMTGQACTATSRVIATPGISDPLRQALRLEMARYAPGNGLDPSVLMGPVVSAAQLDSNLRYLDIARANGSQVEGGDVMGGRMQRPALVSGVEPDDLIAQDEVFGPVIAVIEANDLDHAIAIANNSAYGLAAGIVTNDLRSAHEFAERIQAGMVRVNRPSSGVDLNAPFGGIKESSTNTYREQGADAMDFYTWTKTVYLGHGE